MHSAMHSELPGYAELHCLSAFSFQRGTKTGGIETFEAPIHISNVALVDPSTKKPTRVGHRVEEQVKDGVKRTVRVRFAKKSGKDL